MTRHLRWNSDLWLCFFFLLNCYFTAYKRWTKYYYRTFIRTEIISLFIITIFIYALSWMFILISIKDYFLLFPLCYEYVCINGEPSECIVNAYELPYLLRVACLGYISWINIKVTNVLVINEIILSS